MAVRQSRLWGGGRAIGISPNFGEISVEACGLGVAAYGHFFRFMAGSAAFFARKADVGAERPASGRFTSGQGGEQMGCVPLMCMLFRLLSRIGF